MLNWLFWPFGAADFGAMMIIGILVFVFWIWMIIDCAKRNFRNTAEKIVWIIVCVVCGWVGVLVYFFVIKKYNPKGLVSKN